MNSLKKPSHTSNNKADKFNTPLNNTDPTQTSAPRPYHPHLTPAPSSLRPHCLARDRLLSWRLASSTPEAASSMQLPAEIIHQIASVIGTSWTEATKELYGTSLLVYHVFCDMNNIPDSAGCPISSDLLSAFLASCTGAHSGSTLANYAAGIRAWHIVHRCTWDINEREYKAILEGTVTHQSTTRLAPASSKHPHRAPFTTDTLKLLHGILNKDNPCNAAIYACIVVTFHCITRLGEFTVPSIKSFGPTKHVSRASYHLVHNHQGLPVMVFNLPATKCSIKGEMVQCTPQDNPVTDPMQALQNHIHLNPATKDTHLFAWKHLIHSIRPLSKAEVTRMIVKVAKSHPGLLNLKGHSLRIGGMLFYLLNGVPFDVVKTMGCWSGDSFTIYLRHHALVLTPFLQSKPELLNALKGYILPPVWCREQVRVP
ncbi:hypothetical protein BKA82DRAFT_154547 [Pisolithus tinctorius]|uniref:Tyr recombinase domain-containing protein n=1 Tax=Pisolithus tinctorius Marx 270 TaxID=870435 RepID=A0A0C3NWI8_PISTI|nr:hypothetical protein BKA82DRAFT_154547 [Pisolithus tinctorius]KIN99730.1 hypothetical protein M404DRAFT_154547 [Pisolithus tinctorius Marx 270]